ncbi:alginate lyase [Nonomuraea fuscirosea]|uniref:Alginate lyase n=2 Tax=Nonomuraea fuscirosea TaxID=1291556 RepID=A0A2T0MSL2_9ACTN|nr:alginate lyase [Nonomuraea fuscirosea]
MLVAAALAVPQPAQAAGFKHPGVLVSRVQLDFVRANLDKEPWKSAWDALQKSSFASLSYPAKPRADVNCGGGSIPDNGCSDERKDAMAAYTHALRWYLSKDARYAKKAIQIMDAWSAVITKHTGSNAPLQTGWAGANFSRAAELIKHTYGGGWSQADRLASKLRTVYLPILLAGRPNNNGNWELIMTDAAIGIAVHLDDRTSFKQGGRDLARPAARLHLPHHRRVDSQSSAGQQVQHQGRDHRILARPDQVRGRPDPGDLPRLLAHRLGPRSHLPCG